MMMMEALAARLKEPPFAEESVESVELCFSELATDDLLVELDVAGYGVMTMPNSGLLSVKHPETGCAFYFSVDGNLPGKSFVVRLKK